jgi:putative SOS response-associated peptidase YedK
MCTNYISTRNEKWVKSALGVELPATPFSDEVFPGYFAPIVYRGRESAPQCVTARFGLLPAWARDAKIGRHTYNARTETVAEKPSFRNAWRRQQFCLVLADAIYEPSYDSGRPVRWIIRRADHSPMAIAGLWDEWRDPATGECVLSFTMLTVNADAHPVMRQFHKPGDEKRTVVILEEPRQWIGPNLQAPAALLLPPSAALETQPSPRRGTTLTERPAEVDLFGSSSN